VEHPWPVLAPAVTGPLPRRAEPPTFSIVIAAYQAEGTVGEAVESALAQTRPPLEVVVCDDGSTDGTADAVRAFGSRVVLLRQPNGGEAAAKNAAVRAAAGEFVAVLDADDAYGPRRLEALSWLATRRPDLDVLVTNAELEVQGEVRRLAYDDSWPFEVEDQRREILRRNFVLGQAAVLRARWLEVGGFDEQVRLTTDWDFFLRMVLSGSRVGMVDAPLAVYRLAAGSLSSDRVAMVHSRIATLRRTAQRQALSDGERRVLHRAVLEQHKELHERRLRAALAGEEPGPRRRALRLAVCRAADPSLRAKAVAAAALPGVAAAVERRRRPGREVGAGLRMEPGA
jgi:glycosyltransferase involved in cell wall biosynthesis